MKRFTGFLFLLCLMLLLPFSSCNKRDSNAVQMRKAEHYMAKDDTLKALESVSLLPDSFLEQNRMPPPHNERCLSAMRFYKAACQMKQGDYEGARHWLKTIIMKDASDDGRERALQAYELLVTLMTRDSVTAVHDSLSDSLVRSLLSNSGSIEHYYGDDNSDSVANQALYSPLYWVGVILLILFLAVLLFFHHKGHKDAVIEEYQKEINQLNRQTQHLQEQTSEQLGVGCQVYERVKAGGTMKNISIDDEQSFVDYFAFAHPQEYAGLTSPYSKLSLRHTTYLILCAMGFSDVEIQDILFVKASTVRNYRLRISKHKRGDDYQS